MTNAMLLGSPEQHFACIYRFTDCCMYCHIVGCRDDQIQCPNMDNACRPKEDYVMCVGGKYRGKCMEGSAACESMDACLGDIYFSYCCEFVAGVY